MTITHDTTSDQRTPRARVHRTRAQVRVGNEYVTYYEAEAEDIDFETKRVTCRAAAAYESGDRPLFEVCVWLCVCVCVCVPCRVRCAGPKPRCVRACALRERYFINRVNNHVHVLHCTQIKYDYIAIAVGEQPATFGVPGVYVRRPRSRRAAPECLHAFHPRPRARQYGPPPPYSV